MITHNDDQGTAIDAYERKQARIRPEFLNQETLDRVARDHAREFIQMGAKSKDTTHSPQDSGS